MKLIRSGDDWLGWQEDPIFDRRQHARNVVAPEVPVTSSESPIAEIQQRTRGIALAALAVFAAMCVPFWIGRVYVLDDLGAFHLPIRDFYSRQLAAGEPFDWMPSLYCGFYLSGEGQLGGYHPLHWLLYRTLPLGSAFNLELLLSYPFLAVGTYLFLRRLVVRRDAAAFGALIFTFSSFSLLHFLHPNAIAVVAHLPWLLWLIDLAISRRTSWVYIGIALLTGSQLLLGYPQYVWFSIVCEVAYAAWQLWRTSGLITICGALLTAKLIGVAVGGVQLLPTKDSLAGSTRQTVNDSFRNSGSLHPLNLVQLIEPYLFETRVAGQNTHELAIYVGAVPLVLCFWLLLTSRRKLTGNAAIIAVGVFGLLALVYAFGEYGPLYRWQASLPVVGDFRFPCRASVLFQFSAAVLAAFAFARLTKPPVTPARGLWALPILSAAALVSACLLWPEHVGDPVLIAVGPILMGIATYLVIQVQRGRAWAPALLILFAAADLGAYGISYALRKTSDLNSFAASADVPPHRSWGRVAPESHDGGSRLRVGNEMLLAGFSRVDGYAGLEPARQLDYSDRAALARAGVQWVRDGDSASWNAIAPLPRVRFATPSKLNVKQSFAKVHSQAELGHEGEIEVNRDRPGAIDLTVRSPAVRTIVIAESYHPGWHATVDGLVVATIPTEDNFIGCLVPSGKHDVQLRFEPDSLKQGLLLSACGLSFTMGWGAVALRRSLAVRFAKPTIVYLKR